MHSSLRLSILVIFLAGSPAPGYAAPPSGGKLLISTIRVIDAEPALAEALTEELVAKIPAATSHAVVTEADIRAMLEQNVAAQLADCTEPDCFAPAAAAIDARRVIFGSIGKVGTNLVVGLTLLDAGEHRMLGNVAETVKDRANMVAAVPNLVANLFGLESATPQQYELPAGKKLSLAVFDLQALDVSDEAALSLSQVLAVTVRQIRGTTVISQADIRSMLELEAQKQALGCDDEECFAEVGGALGVDLLISGSVGRLQNQYIVSLQLIDARRGKVEARLTESFLGEETQLINAVRHAGRSLLGITPTEPGTLALASSEAAAEIFIDDQGRGKLPMPAIEGLEPGKHRLRLSKSGFYDWQNEVYVEPSATTAVWATLEETPPRFYQQWWFWTAIGAVVVGAGTFWVVSAQSLPDTDLGTVEIPR